MSRVLTFSRVFPSYHPRKGEPTYFVEKILNSFSDKNNYYCCKCHRCGFMGMSNVWNGGGQIADTGDYGDLYCPKCELIYMEDEFELTETYYIGKYEPKYHTIRAGKRWKVGDKFSPRVWSGKPYASKQIIIADDIEIKKVWDISKHFSEYNLRIDGKRCNDERELATNDGLYVRDLRDWFVKPFEGQIICWNESISY